jgi:SAM-dependent methyltransferase
MREQLVARHAHGRSFADIGCMWSVDGAIAFAAEAAGASAVTGMDLMPASPRFAAERERRGSAVRFVQGDLHDERALAEVGEHDVVWCSGVLYHAPHPLLTLQRLRSITAQTLLLATETLALPLRFAAYAPARWMHPARPSPPDPATGYAGWFWLPTRATVRALLDAAGFTVAEEHGRGPFHRTFVATARPS